ncbi:hypothetical protein PoB_001452700 [Plakobranchus ocellatus]|uniref:Uncharacterized protein n=1 Tax=Plakobranchus ocellatus TaxID=259542 RepID=A0AAV3YYF8_9GAST|nr:hypothetical protein PoB_001452700 [Plakobranchus ocellatus]
MRKGKKEIDKAVDDYWLKGKSPVQIGMGVVGPSGRSVMMQTLVKSAKCEPVSQYPWPNLRATFTLMCRGSSRGHESKLREVQVTSIEHPIPALSPH